MAVDQRNPRPADIRVDPLVAFMRRDVGERRHRRHRHLRQIVEHARIGQATVSDQQHILFGQRIGGDVDSLGHADGQAIRPQPRDGGDQIGHHLFDQQQDMARPGGGGAARLLLDQGHAGKRHQCPQACRPGLVGANQRSERLPCHRAIG